MKNTILSIAAAGLLASTLVSCDSTKKTETTKDTTIVNGDTTFTSKSTSETTTTVRSETISAKIPTFSSEEVNKGLAEYAKLKDEYVAAVKSKNAVEIKALSDKYTVWVNQATGWASKLKPDEIQKYSDYMLKLSEEWSTAAKDALSK